MQLQHNPAHRISRGAPLSKAEKVMLMVHGRGASAESILSLSEYFPDPNLAFVAPQATQNSWYPYSFMAPTQQNEPGLSSALGVLGTIVDALHNEYGFAYEHIYLLGFSQGACLALDYAARNPTQYGGVFGLSGGLIGPEGMLPDYGGNLAGTPVFLGCSDVDFHIPKERVQESDAIFKSLNANVLTKLYENFGHSINDDELKIVNAVLASGSF
ncbi:alpha/beta hydrolase [Arundinibacter roseus]|uniref:Phospholipase n=1 Tax=Arundinibacter roseus TaxID=2070510 RepID=A0A4R4K319_9BACT|nr:dienelactone hydrolase family protein [Arundinibacter roseus]TDB60791.1 phospholipase [Arundinibacter roseus]